MPFVLCALFLAVLLIPHFAGAEDPPSKDRKPHSLQEIVVTESKIPQSEENVTQKIDVIDENEIATKPLANRNLSEIFLYQPGMFVNPLSRNDANWGSSGGLGPKYSVYLLDGLPIDSFVDSMSLDPWALQRAEVFRGPASIMYSNYLTMDFAGNETPLAGITNLVLKEKIDAPLSKASIGAGSFNTFNARAYNQGKTGNLNYFGGVNYERSGYTNYGTDNSWLNMIDNPQYKKIRAYLKTTYFFDRDDHKISLFGHTMHHTGDAGRPNRDYSNVYDTVNASYSNQINPWLNAQIKAGYRYYSRTWGEDNYPPDLSPREKDGVRQHIVPADLTLSINHGAGLLTAGADYQYVSYETFSIVNQIRSKGNDVTGYNAGFFIQEKYVAGKWVFRAGGRYNYTENKYNLISGTTPEVGDKSWDRLLWSAGVRYNATPAFSLYTNAGSSFVVPSAKSIGGTLKSSDIGVPGKNGQLPNPNLKPESGLAFDFGIEYRILENLLANARGFFNKVQDVIVENRVNVNPSQSMSVNAGNSKAYGVEAEIRHFISDAVEWFANYTYTKSRISNGIDPDMDGADLSFVPDYLANIGATFRLPYDFMVSPYLHMVGTYYDSTSKSSRLSFGPYQTINANIRKTIVKKKDFSVALNIDLANITNQRYEMPWQFRDVGFNGMASIEVVF